MTTPNIKALAEKIKHQYESGSNTIYFEKAEIMGDPINYRLASALLRVLEDADRLSSALRNADDYIDIGLDFVDEALESHIKLMEELGGE